MVQANSASADLSPVALRARRRITRRLLPYLLLLYFLAYIDRTNVGIAKLQMTRELGFTDTIIGFGAGIFFLAYFLLEIPGTLIVERWSARKWIARIMITWGIVASCMGFIGLPQFNAISPKWQFYGLRALLGLAEAGFFPGIVVYLSHWFRYVDRGRAKSIFMVGLPIATVVGVPLSRWILESANFYGWSGWRWVFIFEGIPSVLAGIFTLYYLTDWPQDAKWLPEDEKQWLVGQLEAEYQEKAAHHDETLSGALKRGLRHPGVLLLSAVYFFMVTGYYGLNFFLPSITAMMQGTSIQTQTVITMLPYVFGLIAMLWCGWSSDRHVERRWHTAGPMLLGATALALSIISGNHLGLVVAFFCLAGAGMHAYLPVLWTWPTTFLTASAAAAAVGLINSVGNLGGFLGPYMVGYLRDRTGNFTAAMWFLVGCILIAGLLASRLRMPGKDGKYPDAAD